MFSEALNSPGQESEPCSLGSSVARNQDVEACRQAYRWDRCEVLGRSENEHRGGLESAEHRRPSPRPEGEGSMFR